MGLISLTLPNDGETVDAADVNTPFNTLSTVINGNLDNANIKSDAAIDGTKIADNSIPATKMKSGAEGWTGLANTPNTVTYNGNRNYDLVFNSVDISNTLSPGMKIRLQRTVAAPYRCTDLESGSTQYYSKSSPTGAAQTDDITCMAWIKLESYTGGVQIIIARANGSTDGWNFYINSNGQVILGGARAADDLVTSYATVPLNKWTHVAASIDMSGTSGKVYIDGIEVPSIYTNNANSAFATPTGSLTVGAQSTGTYPFDGKIAQVALFSSVLSASTIRSYASQTLSGSESTLVSAYSFDGAITDLNTTNANNLTANNSAVATATDSPFANAVSAGLQEYAEINTVTFSTNTTVNVRVPDTSMIPTSGGVSNVYYAVGANPYGLPYFSNVLAQVYLLAGQGSISGVTDVLGLKATVYVPTNAQIKVTAKVGMTGSVANLGTAFIYEDSSEIIAERAPLNATGGWVTTVNPSIVRYVSSGNHTYQVRAEATAGGGTVSVNGNNISPRYGLYLLVELV